MPVLPRVALLTLSVVGLGFGGCAQRPQDVAVASHGREYFPSSVYGSASRRVIADGQPVPRGGGQYLVGKPYTIAGRTYYPSESRRVQVGNASWYGDAFHGRLTANGEIYDRDGLTAASPTMPLPSYARVTNLRNNYSMIVRVNDRGPYASDRIMDVSRRVAESLDFKRYGTAKIKVEYVGRASLAGSDDAKLYATLKTNGPAIWQGEQTMVAEAARPRARVASIAPYAPPEPEAEPVYERRGLPVADVRPMPRREARPAYVEVDERRIMRRPVVVASSGPAWHGGERVRREEDYRRVSVHEPVAVRRPPPPRFVERDLVPPSRPRFARTVEDAPMTRVIRVTSHGSMLPPSRPMDLGTIPGAGTPIRARRDTMHLRMARARDD